LTTVHAFEDQLTPDGLSALMRSTWTWDDRALRRDLSVVLAAVDAARFAASTADVADHAEALRERARDAGAEFVAAVLGPKLIADTGAPLREHFVAPALDVASFARNASSAFSRVCEQAGEYAARQSGTGYAPESSWLTLISNDGLNGLATAMRTYGHDLSPSPFFANAGLAWQTLRAVGQDSEEATEYAKAIASGTISATVAAAEESGSWDPALVRTKAARTTTGWHLSGVKQFAPAAEAADVCFVIARSTAGPSLFAVERSAPGLQVRPLAVVDETRPLYKIELADTPATLIGTEGSGGRLMMSAIDLATTALAAEQAGLIEKAMALLAHTPPQAGLGAVTLCHVAALSLWRRALTELTAGSADAPAAAAAAHIGCSRAAVRAATTAAELLGPSSETDALVNRALSGNLLFGGPALSHERHLERLGV
jgi:Acyl-CoA dehydrogenase, middle domain